MAAVGNADTSAKQQHNGTSIWSRVTFFHLCITVLFGGHGIKCRKEAL